MPFIMLALGGIVGWFSRRHWYRFEKRSALKAHLSGWRTEIENINPERPDAQTRIWLAYRAGVPDLQRLACLGYFSGQVDAAIYRLSHIPYEEIANAEGNKCEFVCAEINRVLEAAK